MIKENRITGIRRLLPEILGIVLMLITVKYAHSTEYKGIGEAFAHNDEINIASCKGSGRVAVLSNDALNGCTPSTAQVALVAGKGPYHGAAQVNNLGEIIYTVSGGYSGADSLIYRAVCGADTAYARVLVNISAVESAFVDDVWYFGRALNASDGSPGIIFARNASGVYEPRDASGEAKVRTFENSLVVSSPYCGGQTVFYTQHNQLYNNRHEVMYNGAFDGHESTADGLAACYMDDNKYLMFSVTNAYPSTAATRGLKAYIIDMDLDNGKGGRTSYEYTVEPEHKNMSESIELLARAGTSNQYWLIYAHSRDASATNYYSNRLYSRLVDVSNPDNPQISPVIDSIGKTHSSPTYVLVASPTGNHIAVSGLNNQVVVVDFNRTTGKFVSGSQRKLSGNIPVYTYGIAFSPSGKYMYVANYGNMPSQNSIAELMRFDVSGTGSPVLLDSLRYWNPAQTNNNKGGGLKLGPDGKIYVAQAYSNKVGAISDPDATTPLSARYNPNALTLSLTGGNFLEFSTGITKADVATCNVNTAPEAYDDYGYEICTGSGATVAVNVLRNDGDPNPDDTIFLTDAFFADDDDYDLADLSVEPADSTVRLTVKAGVSVADGHVFQVIYSIKDNGVPASRCDEAVLTVVAKLCLSLKPDTASILANTPVNVGILQNDLITCNRGALDNVGISASMHPHHGSAGVVYLPSDTILQYTPDNGCYGVDSLRYVVEDCNGLKDSTMVYVVIHKPLADSYAACTGGVATLGFEHIDGVEYFWYDAADGGSLLKTSSDTIIVEKGSARDLGEWWAEPRWNGKMLSPRIRVVFDELPQPVAADFRLQICPASATPVNLTSYVDSTYLNNVVWYAVSPDAPTVSPTGEFNTANVTRLGTFVYEYVLSSTENGCSAKPARAFVRILADRIMLRTDTVRVCKEHESSQAINLNQLMGLELDGVWSYPADADNAIADNVTASGAGSLYSGALTFNAVAAYYAAGASYNLNGDATVKIFRFRYSANAASCARGAVKEIVISVY
jgi:hypothetical protein